MEGDEDEATNIIDVASAVVHGAAVRVHVDQLGEAFTAYNRTIERQVLRTDGGLKATGVDKLRGNVFEAHHARSFDIAAAAKGIPRDRLRAILGGERTEQAASSLRMNDPQVDVRTIKRESLGTQVRLKDHQAKAYADADATRAALSKVDPEGNMRYGARKLAPADQVEAIRERPVGRVAPHRRAAFEHTRENTRAEITETYGDRPVSSDPMADAEAVRLTRDAQRGEVAYARETEVRRDLMLHDVRLAARNGVAIGAGVAIVGEVVRLGRRASSLSEDDFTRALANILVAGVDGGSRGGIVALAGHLSPSSLRASSLGSTLGSAAASAAYDFGKNLYRYCTDEISGDDLLCLSAENVVVTASASVGTLAGGAGAATAATALAGTGSTIGSAIATGATFGTPLGPLGVVIGGALGGLVVGLGVSALTARARNEGLARVRADLDSLREECVLDPAMIPLAMIDRMGSLSPRGNFSFRSLIPFYNVFGDLEEYRQRRLALAAIAVKAEAALDARQAEASLRIVSEHREKCVELERRFVAAQTLLEQSTRDGVAELQADFARYAQFHAYGLTQIDGRYDALRERQARLRDSHARAEAARGGREAALAHAREFGALNVDPRVRGDVERILAGVVSDLAADSPVFLDREDVDRLFGVG